MGNGFFQQVKQSVGLVKREERIENYTLQIEQIQKIMIEACAIDILVDTHTKPCVEVEFITFEDGPEMEITHGDDDLRINVHQEQETFNLSTQKATLMIKALPEVAKEWRVITTSGEVELRNIETSHIHVQVSSGAVDCKTIQAEEVIVEATSGNIEMDQIAASKLRATISSGVIELSGIYCDQLHTFATSGTIAMKHIVSKTCTSEASSGDIKVAHMQSEYGIMICSSGSIHVRDGSVEHFKVAVTSGDFSAMDLRTSSAHMEATSGDLFTSLDPSMTDYELEGVAGTGDVNINLPIDFSIKTENHVIGSLGTGEKNLYFQTSSGDVRVRM